MVLGKFFRPQYRARGRILQIARFEQGNGIPVQSAYIYSCDACCGTINSRGRDDNVCAPAEYADNRRFIHFADYAAVGRRDRPNVRKTFVTVIGYVRQSRSDVISKLCSVFLNRTGNHGI